MEYGGKPFVNIVDGKRTNGHPIRWILFKSNGEVGR